MFFNVNDCPSAMIEDWYESTNRTWGAALADSATRHPERELIIYGDQRVTYRQLHERVQAFARGLLALGVVRGDKLALWVANCPEWMVAQFAAYEIGAALVPIHTRFSRDEVAYALERSDACILIFQSSFLGEKIDALAWVEELLPELFSGQPEKFACQRFPKLKQVVFLGPEAKKPAAAYGFEDVAATGVDWRQDDALREAQLVVNPFDVANIIFTSGTTGFPKGGLSMHRNNMAALYHWIRRSDLRAEDRMYLGVPFATNFGCAYVSQLSVLAGNTIIVDDAFSPATALQAIQDEKVSWFPGAPTMYIMMLGHPDLETFDLTSLRAAIVGGAPCPPQTIRAMKQKMGFEFVIHCYGLSECAGLSTSTLIDDPIEKAATTVGLPFPSCQVQVTDPKSAAPLAPGEQGEIWLADVAPGSAVGKGYYNDPEKTAETITPDGWFRTGDLGVMDEDGYLSITGRLKEMFVVGGYNAYPAEIEGVLHTHPKVKMAQTFGVPDGRLGEVGCAYIELRSGEETDEADIVEFCKERMANYKVPRYVRFVNAVDFPLTSSGKVKKFELRKRAVDFFGIEEGV
jgi:fatty-acyl-CoA synthase